MRAAWAPMGLRMALWWMQDDRGNTPCTWVRPVLGPLQRLQLLQVAGRGAADRMGETAAEPLRSKTFKALQTLKQHKGHAGGGERRAGALSGARCGCAGSAAAALGLPLPHRICPLPGHVSCCLGIPHHSELPDNVKLWSCTAPRTRFQPARRHARCPQMPAPLCTPCSAAPTEGVLLLQEARFKKGIFGGPQSHWWTLFMCVREQGLRALSALSPALLNTHSLLGAGGSVRSECDLCCDAAAPLCCRPLPSPAVPAAVRQQL